MGTVIVDEIVMEAALRFVPRTLAILAAVAMTTFVAAIEGAVRPVPTLTLVASMELALMALVATMFGAVRPVPMLTFVPKMELALIAVPATILGAVSPVPILTFVAKTLLALMAVAATILGAVNPVATLMFVARILAALWLPTLIFGAVTVDEMVIDAALRFVPRTLAMLAAVATVRLVATTLPNVPVSAAKVSRAAFVPVWAIACQRSVPPMSTE